MKLYIAGPMRGIPYYNFPSFDKAKARLEAQGHTVMSPADMDRKNGFDGTQCPDSTDWFAIPDGFDYKACVRRDVMAILECDGIVMLKGWRESQGAKAERTLAIWYGLAVWEEES